MRNKESSVANNFVLTVIKEYRATFYLANGRHPRITTLGPHILVDGQTRYTVEKLQEMTANLRWRITGDRHQRCA